MGPDLYTHYNEMFVSILGNRKFKKLQHKELIFMPVKTYTPGVERFWKTFYSTGALTRYSAVWLNA